MFRGEDKIPHNMEVHLRSLGLPTMLVNGVVTLSRNHTVCQKGDNLSPEQAQILKLFYIQQAEFKLEVLGFWNENQFTVLKERKDDDDEQMEEEE